MKQMMLFGLVAILILMPTAHAGVEFHMDQGMMDKQCVSDNLYWNGTLDTNDDTGIYQFNMTQNCPYGCDDVLDQCNPAPFTKYLYLLAFVGGMIILVFAVLKFK